MLALGFVFAACSKADSPTVADATTTTAPATTTSTTMSTTIPNGPVTTPDAAANGLFNSWKTGDQDGASRYARQNAISKIFAHPYAEGGVTYMNQGCEPQGGQYVCSWTYAGGALQMTIEGVLGNNGFVVDSVTYIAD